jgi:hypothetical protein
MGVMAGQDRTRVISQTVVLGWTSPTDSQSGGTGQPVRTVRGEKTHSSVACSVARCCTVQSVDPECGACMQAWSRVWRWLAPLSALSCEAFTERPK